MVPTPLCDKPSPFDVKITYNWLHIPTGKTGVNTRVFYSREEFFEQLNHWNQDARWKYWSA